VARPGDTLDAKISEQAEKAVADADVVLLVVDVTIGVTDEDLEAAKVIAGSASGPPRRQQGRRHQSRRLHLDFIALGVGDPWPVSALHGRGTGDLLDEIVTILPVTTSPDWKTTLTARTAPSPPTPVTGRRHVWRWWDGPTLGSRPSSTA